MTGNLEVEARDEGMFTSLKTKLKNTDNLLLYSGVTKTKGLSDDEDVKITMSFDADGNINQVSKITKGGKTIETTRSYKIVNDNLSLLKPVMVKLARDILTNSKRFIN